MSPEKFIYPTLAPVRPLSEKMWTFYMPALTPGDRAGTTVVPRPKRRFLGMRFMRNNKEVYSVIYTQPIAPSLRKEKDAAQEIECRFALYYNRMAYKVSSVMRDPSNERQVLVFLSRKKSVRV